MLIINKHCTIFANLYLSRHPLLSEHLGRSRRCPLQRGSLYKQFLKRIYHKSEVTSVFFRDLFCIILRITIAWDQAPHSEKEKKIGERSEPRGIVWGVERWQRHVSRLRRPLPHPQATAGFALLANIFPFHPVFCLFPPLRSLAPA